MTSNALYINIYDIKCLICIHHISVLELSFTIVSYDSLGIVRGSEDNYTFTISASNADSTHVVVKLTDTDNFVFEYFYDSQTYSDGTAVAGINKTTAMQASGDARAAIAAASSTNMAVMVGAMTLAQCPLVTHVCLYFHDATLASYTEADLTNNIHCYDITAIKVCSPRKSFNINHTRLIGSPEFPEGKKITGEG